MGFLRKLWDRIKYGEYGEWLEDNDGDGEDFVDASKLEETLFRHHQIDMADGAERIKYIRHCFEEAASAAKEIDKLTYEYTLVTSYLTDMEEIEALPNKAEIERCARKLTDFMKERAKHQDNMNAMPEAQYRQMEKLEDEITQACAKLKESEEYLALVKQDLNRLDGERHAYQYRKHEVAVSMQNARGMALICACALPVTIGMLLALQYVFEMDARVGYIITAGAAALAITLLYMKYMDSRREMRKIEKQVNRLILLQNTVKIRYVNAVKLLDYLYMKYQVSSSNEMQAMWERFEKERSEREKYREANSECAFYEQELIKELRKYNIKDPIIWTHQAEAIYNPKEMVEIRHGLIVRRQKLRAQMEYNRNISLSASQEVKDLAAQYPQYAKEILQIVSEYE